MRVKPLVAVAALAIGTVFAVPASMAAAAPTRYEAENSPAVCTGTIDSNWPGYSGSGFCNGTNASGAYAQFTVSAPAAGTATLGVRFANGTTTVRPAGVIVNGSTVQSLSFEGTGAWSTWATKSLTVNVNAGTNTIRLNPTSSAGLPNVDYLDFEVGTPQANALYVATGGNDTNAGTLSAPLRTIQRAVDLAQPGYTIYVRGGTYAPSANIQLLKNGTSSQPITMRNYNGERVIIDGENMPYTPGAVGSTIPRPERGAIHIEGLVAADRARNHPRPLRRLRFGHQQQRLRPPRHAGQLRVGLAPAGIVEQQPDHQFGQLRQPRPAQERRERRRARDQRRFRKRQRRAGYPAVEQLR